MKKEFYNYIGPTDSLYTYVRSYKLVLFKCFFELMDSTGCAFAYDVAKRFKEFYMQRVDVGKIPDSQVEPRIENIRQSSVQDVYNVIMTNPFKHINENGFLLKRATSDGKEQFYLPPQLVQELTGEDLKRLKEIIEDKLTLYYSKIDNTKNGGNMKEFVERFIAEYVPSKQETFAGHSFGYYIRNTVPKLIYDTGLVDEDKYLITGRVGQGNWAMVPLVCIFDRQITTTATKGVYIVYLLSKDGNTLYLTFNQGCTEISQQHSKRETIAIMRQKADEIVSRVNNRGFASDQNISLGDGLTQLAEFYEKGIILYKAYNKGSIPEESELRTDLKNMIDIYKEYVAGEQKSTEWWPSIEEYDPGITKEKWLEILNETDVLGNNIRRMLGAMCELGGSASCAQLANKYGNTTSHYIMSAVHAAERTSKYTGCPVMQGEEHAKWWPVLFVGKNASNLEAGTFIWKIRDELYQALTEFGITKYLKKAGEKEMTIKEKLEVIKEYIAAKGFNYEGDLIENFYLSLKSKPFVILAGTSGTGKTRLVKLFSEAIDAKMKLVPVRPDWSDSSDLFGHTDLSGRFQPGVIIDFIKQAEWDKETPYFLCLDEMNLARVEYYLSDFLSVVETRDRKSNGDIETDPLVDVEYYKEPDAKAKYGRVFIPENLYIIGTVNMDETTFPFSKKVLDRANTIEFSYVNLMAKIGTEGQAVPQKLDNSFLKSDYLYLRDCDDTDLIDNVCFTLEELNQILVKANLHVGYRVRDEISFYMMNNKKSGLLSEEVAFDYEIMQKILPRVQGSSAAIKETLSQLFIKCAGDYTGFAGISAYEQMNSYIESKECKYPNSAKKITFMMRRYEEDGFTSYWL